MDADVRLDVLLALALDDLLSLASLASTCGRPELALAAAAAVEALAPFATEGTVAPEAADLEAVFDFPGAFPHAQH